MLENKQHYCIPASHPCLAGHFPDNPIIPGVVILNYVENQLLAWLPEYRIHTLTQAKFLQPLHPNENFVICLKQSSAHNIKFSCYHHLETLVTGSFIIEAKKGQNND